MASIQRSLAKLAEASMAPIGRSNMAGRLPALAHLGRTDRPPWRPLAKALLPGRLADVGSWATDIAPQPNVRFWAKRAFSALTDDGYRPMRLASGAVLD
jgi:hypothetical protein